MNPMARTREAIAKVRPVLAGMRNGFSLIVAPHGTKSPTTFNLPANVGLLLSVLVIVFVVGLAFVGVTYTRMAMLALQTTRLRSENELLRAQNAKIGEIESEMAHIEEFKRQIETWAGIMEERRRPAAGRGDDLPLSNSWPRRYTYGIMKPFYTEFAAYSRGMILPADGWVSRGFADDVTVGGGHPGVDLVAPKGTPVRCALDGVVKSARWDDVYGNVIVVEHGDSLRTLYGHNDKMLVKEGESVKKGQIIAVVGSTGKSTAPHVHFEILKNNKPIDPGAYMDFTKSNTIAD
jgi:murein DD-endopeptidase MepM/ murein hydrolase activator NlpD